MGKTHTYWLIGLGVLLFIFYTLGEMIPPKDLTFSRLGSVANKIIIYFQTHGAPPKTLEELPQREGYDDSILDGWGTKIEMKRMGSDQIELRSAGPDGKFGTPDDMVQGVNCRKAGDASTSPAP